MEYRIIERESFTVIGKTLEVSTRDGENFRRIPEFWQESNQDGTSDKLLHIGRVKDLLGICMHMDHAREVLSYWIAVEAGSDADPQSFETAVIPAAAWAVFTTVGPMPHAIQNVWQRIFHEWFPGTGYEHTGGADFELYPPGDITAEDYRCEIWIPVKKK